MLKYWIVVEPIFALILLAYLNPPRLQPSMAPLNLFLIPVNPVFIPLIALLILFIFPLIALLILLFIFPPIVGGFLYDSNAEGLESMKLFRGLYGNWTGESSLREGFL